MNPFFPATFEQDPEPFRTFVNRRSEIDRIAAAFFKNGKRAVGLVAPRGQGRTSLVRKFAHDYADRFDGLVRCRPEDYRALESVFLSVDGFDPDVLEHFARARQQTSFMTSDFEMWRSVHSSSDQFRLLCSIITQRPTSRALILIDSVDGASDDAVAGVIGKLLTSLPNACLLVVGPPTLRASGIDEIIELGPLNSDDLREAVLRHFGVAVDEIAIHTIFNQQDDWRKNLLKETSAMLGAYPQEFVRGFYSTDTLRAYLSVIAENRHLLKDFTRNGLLGPDGKPLDENKEKVVLAHVHAADAALLDRILADQNAIHSLSSRQFEELVAQVLERLGYSVTLTPASRDGGFDIFAAVNDKLGQFLYVVECKKYAPDRPVGVGLVRALHGSVEATRASAGIMVTTSHFTRGAHAYQKQIEARLSLRSYVDLRTWLDELSTLRKPRRT